jgi:hypothetical protein
LDPTESHQQFAEVLQFCPQAPVKSIEIALALSTLATVSLTEESFTRIRELAKWRSPEDRPSCFDPFQELPRLDMVLAFRARGTGAKPFVVPTDWQAKAVAIKSLALRSPSMIAALLILLARILQGTLPNTTNDRMRAGACSSVASSSVERFRLRPNSVR